MGMNKKCVNTEIGLNFRQKVSGAPVRQFARKRDPRETKVYHSLFSILSHTGAYKRCELRSFFDSIPLSLFSVFGYACRHMLDKFKKSHFVRCKSAAAQPLLWHCWWLKQLGTLTPAAKWKMFWYLFSLFVFHIGSAQRRQRGGCSQHPIQSILYPFILHESSFFPWARCGAKLIHFSVQRGLANRYFSFSNAIRALIINKSNGPNGNCLCRTPWRR